MINTDQLGAASLLTSSHPPDEVFGHTLLALLLFRGGVSVKRIPQGCSEAVGFTNVRPDLTPLQISS